MNRKFIAALVCGSGLVVSGSAMAQVQVDTAQPGQPGGIKVRVGEPNQNPAQGQAQAQNSDTTLASCVAIANQEEIAIAKFAQDRLKNDDAKEFAKMLVKDHQAFLQKLQKFAPEASRDGYLMDRGSNTENRDSKQDNSALEQRKSQQTAQRQGQQQVVAKPELNQPLDVVALHREIAENCLQSAKQKMSKEDDSKIDACFIGHQIVAHEAMMSKLQVFERHASGELGQVLAMGLQKTEEHLKKAEEIMKDLEKDSSKSSRREDRQEQRRENKENRDNK